jgi:hypothetical protein
MKKTNVVLKDFPSFAFLSKSEIDVLTNNDQSLIQRIEYYDCDIQSEMIDLIVDKLNLSNDNEYYFDIDVSLDDMTFKVNNVYDATYGTYSIILVDKLNFPELPMTFTMPTLFDKIIKNDF